MQILIPPDDNITKSLTDGSLPHKHLMWEIVFFVEGKCLHHIQDKTFNCVLGDVFIVGPEHVHSVELLEEKHNHRDLYFTDEHFKKICSSLNIPGLYADICKYIVYLKFDNSTILNLLEQLKTVEIYEILNKTTPSEKNLQNFNTCLSSCDSILYFLLGNYSLKNLKQTRTDMPEWLLNLLLDLNNPNFFSLKPSEIIQQTGYSHSRFSELFKSYMNTSLADYMIKKRLQYASNLLITTNKTTLEICTIVGYDSYSCFVRLFKKLYSLSPLQYRQLHRKQI